MSPLIWIIIAIIVLIVAIYIVTYNGLQEQKSTPKKLGVKLTFNLSVGMT